MDQNQNEQENSIRFLPADRQFVQQVQFKTVEIWQDAVAISRMARTIWYEHYTPVIGFEQVEYMLRHFQTASAIWRTLTEENMAYIQVFAGNTPAGYLAFRSDHDLKKMFISKFYLLASYRGRGIARQMLNYLSSIALEEDLAIIWLTVNKNNLNSIQVYLKMGFKIKGKSLQDIGSGYVMDDYIMEKLISK